MRVVVVASQKGGAGKSTLAAHFATLADGMAGKGKRPALLLD
jgi:cellulose biosynthesis protein BcsQ